MHTMHHSLFTSFEPQATDASPAADKRLSEFADADRVGH